MGDERNTQDRQSTSSSPVSPKGVFIFSTIWLIAIIGVYIFASSQEIPGPEQTQTGDTVTKAQSSAEVSEEIPQRSELRHKTEDVMARWEQRVKTEERMLTHGPSFGAIMNQGEKVYNKLCAACHGPSGGGIKGVFPAIAGSKIATGDIQKNINLILNGKKGTAMASYRNMLAPEDLAAVITYQRNAFGNNTGDIVSVSQLGIEESRTILDR